MHVNMAKRMFAWGTTKAGFKHRIEAYVLENHGIENLLVTLVVRHTLKVRLEGEAYKLSPKFRIAVAETGVSLGGTRIRPASLSDVSTHTLQLEDFAKIPSCFEPEAYHKRVAKIEAMPLVHVSPRTVRMPDGWYAVCGAETGPFKSRDAAKAALAVVEGF